jgi:hypothetical protein
MDTSPKPVYCPEKGITYPSINSITMSLGIKYNKIRNVLAGASKSTKGFSFEWYNPDKHPAPNT